MAKAPDDLIGESIRESAAIANLPKNDQNASEQPLYIQKETYFRSTMNVNVKLMNMELWVTDYENQPKDLAQILQLEFQSDLFYESEQFGKDIECSPNPDKTEKKQLILSGIDEKGCHTS